jgi:hypothetical protein
MPKGRAKRPSGGSSGKIMEKAEKSLESASKRVYILNL